MQDRRIPLLDPEKGPLPAYMPHGEARFALEMESFAKRLERGEDVQSVIADLRLRAKMARNRASQDAEGQLA